MSSHFADRLVSAVKDKQSCAVVGIDPVYSMLPRAIIERYDLDHERDLSGAIDAIFEFSTKVLRIHFYDLRTRPPIFISLERFTG